MNDFFSTRSLFPVTIYAVINQAMNINMKNMYADVDLNDR